MAPVTAVKGRRAKKPVVPEFEFGDRLRKARLYAGLTLAPVAAEMGVSEAAVSKWERNESPPRNVWDIVERYQNLTGVDKNWLLTGENMTLTYTSPFRRPPDGGEPISLQVAA